MRPSRRRRHCPEFSEHPTMLVGVAHHSALPDGSLADLELGLDQGYHIARRAEQVADAGQHQPQRDEGDIDHRQVRGGWQPIEAPDVDSLEHGDAWVLTKTPGQLTITNVDRDHRAAPRRSKASVKPPVDAPTSRQTRPVGSSPKASSAAGQFFASPTDKFFGSRPGRGRRWGSTNWSGRSATSPATRTRPARTIAWARCRDGTSPWATSAWSRRTRPSTISAIFPARQ